MSRTRLVVLISGSGTLLQALLDAAPTRTTRPRSWRSWRTRPMPPGSSVPGRPASRRSPWRWPATPIGPPGTIALRDALESFEPDWVVSAGFMRHPRSRRALGVPDAGGQHPPGAAAQLPRGPRRPRRAGPRRARDRLHDPPGRRGRGHRARSSTSEPVPVDADDDEASLHERIKVVERALLVDVVAPAGHPQRAHLRQEGDPDMSNPDGTVRIRRALVRVYDKTGLDELAAALHARRRADRLDRLDRRADRRGRASR